MENFYKNFYNLCMATGVVDQLVNSGYMENVSLINNKGSEQVLKADLIEDISWIEDYRKLFNSKNTGRSGLTSDSLSVHTKMKRFMIQFDYTKEEILEATQLFIKDNYGTPYVQEADYFIFKKDGKKNEERSKLAAWCDVLREDATKSTYIQDV